VLSSGISGLDTILYGGFLKGRVCLIQGSPGSGKTTLATQFLLQGARQGEKCLFITLAQTTEELLQACESHGWDMAGIEVDELTPQMAVEQFERRQTVFDSGEVELPEISDSIIAAIRRTNAERVVIDSMASIRLLAGNALRYRREVLRIKRFLAEHPATVLMLDDDQMVHNEGELQGLVQGVIRLEQRVSSYLPLQRYLHALKMRGQRFISGRHDFRIATGGIQVYPRLPVADPTALYNGEQVKCDVEAFDAMLGGGLERGTACMIIGQAGTGKSTLAMLHPYAAAQRGEKAAILLFEERLDSYLNRCAAMGFHLKPMMDAGKLIVEPFRAGQVSAGEFSDRIRELIETEQVGLIAIDSLTGLVNSMPGEAVIMTQLGQLLSYMSSKHVVGIITVAQHGLVGFQPVDSVDASYLADAAILLRHFEDGGRIRKSVTVVKKRHGSHETEIRELLIDGSGVRLGDQLLRLQGVLTGSPESQLSGSGERSGFGDV
jgi:circadian clock protein KaiC